MQGLNAGAPLLAVVAEKGIVGLLLARLGATLRDLHVRYQHDPDIGIAALLEPVDEHPTLPAKPPTLEESFSQVGPQSPGFLMVRP